jgi:homoserine kinase type II
MAKYSLLQKNDIQTIADRYNLSLIKFEYIDGGAGNSSYLLYTKQGKYVLTIFEISMTRVAKMGKLLLLLEDHDFPGVRVLPQRTGELTTVHLEKPVMVKHYIEGQVIKDLDNTMLEQVGETMARLHQIPAPDYLPNGYAYNTSVFSNVIGQNIDQEFETWLANKFEYLKQHIPPGLPRSLIHADVFYDNVLFQNERLKALIDFEDACYDYRVFGLGMGILGMCTNDKTILLGKAHALIKGYQKENPLEDQEIDSLKLFVEYAATGISYWRFWMYNIHTPVKEKKRKHRDLMNLAQNINSIPKATFKNAVFN